MVNQLDSHDVGADLETLHWDTQWHMSAVRHFHDGDNEDTIDSDEEDGWQPFSVDRPSGCGVGRVL